MRSPPDVVALACGYTIISNNSPTVMEIEGAGDWAKVEKACRKFVKRGIPGRAVDHVTVVVRNADGTRELRDVGVNGVRTGALPSVGCKSRRIYSGLGIRGVRKEGHKFRCQMTVHGERLYLGLFATAREAGVRRDRYAVDHNLRIELNYPGEGETLLLA